MTTADDIVNWLRASPLSDPNNPLSRARARALGAEISARLMIDAADTIAGLRAEIAALTAVEATDNLREVEIEALVMVSRKARKTFGEYAQHHYSKGDQDKAQRNAAMAGLLDVALAPFRS